MKISQFLFFAWLLCPAIFWVALRQWYALPKLGCFAYIAGYILLLITVQVIEAELWYDMMAYDLDGDGSVMGAEQTPAAIKAESEWSSDVGRSFAVVTGVPYVLIWYTLVMLVLLSIEAVFKLFRTTNQKHKPNAE